MSFSLYMKMRKKPTGNLISHNTKRKFKEREKERWNEKNCVPISVPHSLMMTGLTNRYAIR